MSLGLSADHPASWDVSVIAGSVPQAGPRESAIAIVHAYYRQLGGEDISTGLERDLLRQAGVPVSFASVQNSDVTVRDRMQLMFSAGYHRGRAAQVLSQLPQADPALVHVQNVWPSITPAIHELLSQRGIPNIQHLRNFRASCLNGKHFRDGRVCLDCLGRSPALTGLRRRCHDGEILRSGLAAAAWWQTERHHIYRDHISGYIAMSRFGIEMAEQAGIPGERIYCKPNFISDPGLGPAPSSSRDICFVGRLSPEKGAEVVVRAWARLRSRSGRLVLIGDGPQREDLEHLATEVLGVGPTVEFRGRLSPEQTLAVVKDCRCLLQPACWFETVGRTVVEAFATGRPVIASRLGALEELTEIFPSALRPAAGDEWDWAAAMERMLADDALADRLGQTAREDYVRCFTPQANCDLMLGIYADVIARSGNPLPEYLSHVRRAVPGAHYRQYHRESEPQ
jgi:glycosyltransferase involved in cell wall biosynthesis